MTVPPTPLVGPRSRVRLHDIAMRPDGEEWIVGRMATGTFVAVPEIGARAIRLLGDGAPVGEVNRRLAAECGDDPDIAAFVTDLVALEFVAEIDGLPVPTAEPPRPSLPWIEPRHVAFALRPGPAVAVGALILAGAAALVRRPELVPGHRDVLWSSHGSLVLLTVAAAGWALLLLHELAHLVTARAAGVPARLRLGTRLHFLVMQTDMSGIEMSPRRHRLTAYLAGIAVNLAVAATAILLLASPLPRGAAADALAALIPLALLPLSFQLMVFMRTDIYFVLQDLTGCRNLFGDGTAYARYLAHRAAHAARGRRGPPPSDPSARLPARERTAVRWYSAVLVSGTALCLAAFALLTLPVEAALLATAGERLAGDGIAAAVDGAVVVTLLVGGHALWAVTKWRARRRVTAPRR
ncbi:hypothetical protein [Streptomyces litchfieldiae]|uniref:PqqD family protein n=1 Tax=Streptomyces litchfieldiae TaxID=3075543 RepID=A0ABU2MMA7_9ACTN|nr:hypothetical protein [Streptomyces sp. DSM 44938]MDT0342630.1 hypothetical protein [Streptomyces sp. DSM 44938]